jgi:hypothetical protein
VPDYEITIAGRIGPVVASCLPGLRAVAAPATVLHALASNERVVPKILGMLADHHLTILDVWIHPVLTGPSRPRRPTSAIVQRQRIEYRNVVFGFHDSERNGREHESTLGL